MRLKLFIVGLCLLVAACSTPKSHSKAICEGNTLKSCEPVIYFASDSYQFTSEQHERLQWAIEKLRRWQNRTLEITGYADKSERDAKALSRKRAQVVANYMQHQGIIASRIKIKADGSKNPVSKKKHWKNRRVVITFGYK